MVGEARQTDGWMGRRNFIIPFPATAKPDGRARTGDGDGPGSQTDRKGHKGSQTALGLGSGASPAFWAWPKEKLLVGESGLGLAE